MNETLIKRLLRECYQYAESYSDDLSNRNGALILLDDTLEEFDEQNFVIAANRIPPGVNKTDERIKTRPTKYDFMEHAERGVIFEAARRGISCDGKTMVCPWVACSDCARAIVLSGIRRVIAHKQRCDMTAVGRDKVIDTVANRWNKPISNGDLILQEPKIEIYYYDGVVGDVTTLVNEQVVTSL